MSSKLYKRDTYLNKGIPFIFNTVIYEYDIRHAGISISKELKLLPKNTLDRIEKKSKNKKEISIALGKIQRSNKEFKEELSRGFEKMREKFFEANDLNDSDILSIKKDAIFAFKQCNNLDYGEVSFSLKNKYSSFIYTGLYELYYNVLQLDVKGIDDKNIFPHKDYIIEFIKTVFYKREFEGKEAALRYIRVMADRYKRFELEVEFYRNFDKNGLYKSKDGEVLYSDITKTLLSEVDISYNWQNIFVPLLQAII